MDGYLFCSYQAQDNAKTKAKTRISQNDHGHRYEIELGRHAHWNQTIVGQMKEDSQCEVREANGRCSGQENALPEVLAGYIQSSLYPGEMLTQSQILTG